MPRPTPLLRISSLHTLALSALLFCASASATPPLVLAADVADAGLRVWWRVGDLLIGPPSGDPRPGMRPLIGPAEVAIPVDLAGWSALGETCAATLSVTFPLDGEPATATAEGTWELPVIRLRSRGRVIAEAPLGRPGRVCEIAVGEADAVPGLEVLVTWRLGGGSSELRGLNIYRIPDTAR